MTILNRNVPTRLSNLTCVAGRGLFAVTERAIFTAHAAESDNADYRTMLDAARQSAQYGQKFAVHLIRLDGPNGVRS
jgi:hypothetical protein